MIRNHSKIDRQMDRYQVNEQTLHPRKLNFHEYHITRIIFTLFIRISYMKRKKNNINQDWGDDSIRTSMQQLFSMCISHDPHYAHHIFYVSSPTRKKQNKFDLHIKIGVMTRSLNTHETFFL